MQLLKLYSPHYSPRHFSFRVFTAHFGRLLIASGADANAFLDAFDNIVREDVIEKENAIGLTRGQNTIASRLDFRRHGRVGPAFQVPV